MIDLHMHSTASDGSLAPEALMERAHGRGLKTVALTDHDTVEGLSRARRSAEALGMEFIPGIEISANFEPGTMHVLGYFFDETHPALTRTLADLQKARTERNPEIIGKLRMLGIDITYEEVVAVSGGGQVGRPHFAQVLIEKKVARTYTEAFQKFLKKGAAAYVDKRRLSPVDSIRAITEAGGAAVLAHPKQLKLEGYDEIKALLEELKEAGLAGIEAYHSSHKKTEAKHLCELANRLDLVATGGSDFHGRSKKDIELGMLAAGKRLDPETIDKLRKKARDGHAR